MLYEPTLSRDLLRLKLAEPLTATLPELTARDVRLPHVAGNVLAVIGVRRGGKTSVLQRTMVERIARGSPRVAAGEPPLLVQVALDTAADETWDREVRALADGLGLHRRARGLLITLDSAPPLRPLPARIDWMPAARWLLEAGLDR